MINEFYTYKYPTFYIANLHYSTKSVSEPAWSHMVDFCLSKGARTEKELWRMVKFIRVCDSERAIL